MNYWDTSALLKLFVSELGSSEARAVLARDREIATGLLTYVEAFKTLDAVHLASLLELGEHLGERIPLVVADGRRLRARRRKACA